MIKTSLNLGDCFVKIEASIKKDQEQAILQKGIEKLAYHASASKVFGAKGHDRDESFSDALEADLRKGLNLVISPFCDSLKFEIAKKAPSKTKKAPTVEEVLAGLSEEQLQAALDARKKVEAPKAEAEVVSMG